MLCCVIPSSDVAEQQYMVVSSHDGPLALQQAVSTTKCRFFAFSRVKSRSPFGGARPHAVAGIRGRIDRMRYIAGVWRTTLLP